MIVEDQGQRACRVVFHSGKSRLPRVREVRYRRRIETVFEGSIVAARTVGEEVLTEKRVETGRRDERRRRGM